MSSSSSTSSTTPGHRNVVPSEVGWQFVPQYYTFVNKQPDRLHCFYTKKSTFIHGTEGEDEQPACGQTEIHAKITSLDFQNCKVFIHSVDAQSSADGGIIIQVIGEMSNRGEQWRKFVQTFFLAEQPNGYFVLNDIFRFLKEDAVEPEEGDAELEAPVPKAQEAEPAPVPAVEPPAPVREPTPAPPPAPQIEEPTTVEPAPIATSEVTTNGYHVEEKQAPTPEPEPEPEPIVAPHPAHTPAPAPAPPQAPPTPAPAPTAPSPQPAAQPAVPTQPAQPAAPKTWANLAATNSKKWGTAVAQGSVVASSSPAARAPPAAPNGASAAAAPATPKETGTRSPLPAATAQIATPHCFIKGVVAPSITPEDLGAFLMKRYGPVKDVDVVRSKACAFVEFTTLESARKAIAEGSVYVEGQNEGMRITIEVRKEKGDRPPSRPRVDSGAGRGRGRGGARGGAANTRGK